MAKLRTYAGNEDDRVHLAYYDKAKLLSFVINEFTFPIVRISEGGYAEPPIDAFHVTDFDRSIDCFDAVSPITFQLACRAWLVTNYPGYAHEEW